jgi:hypothetical protein
LVEYESTPLPLAFSGPATASTRILLSINMRTAKTLGIAIPDIMLVRAERVIE